MKVTLHKNDDGYDSYHATGCDWDNHPIIPARKCTLYRAKILQDLLYTAYKLDLIEDTDQQVFIVSLDDKKMRVLVYYKLSMMKTYIRFRHTL